MKTNGNEMPLINNNHSTYQTISGITYFKLKSEIPGDYTKNCGLLGEEIDRNFYFLRSYDIKDITIDEKRNLIISRVNDDYPPLVVDINQEIPYPDFNFNPKTGVFEVKYPDGSIKEIGGFLIEQDYFKMAMDNTLIGTGTIYDPLRVSDVLKTGTYAPANEYIDLTDGSTLRIDKNKGYRVVTKEKSDTFGYLYPFSSIEKIEEKLKNENSQWRVATKNDWDGLLDSLECPEYRSHSGMELTWLGDVAGAALKSIELWEEYDESSSEKTTNGEDIKNLSLYPIGIIPGDNENLKNENYNDENFGQITGIWTNTLNEDSKPYAKIFAYNSAKVKQDVYGDNAKLSIRLCKDYNLNNYNEIEFILGQPYPTELVFGGHSDYPYAKIWTKINLYSNDLDFDGTRLEDWVNIDGNNIGIKPIFYINEWDGKKWYKKPMNEGDSIVIANKNEIPFREWRLIDNELIDVVNNVETNFNDIITNVYTNVNKEILIASDNTFNLANAYTDETKKQVITYVDDKLELVSEKLKLANDKINVLEEQLKELKKYVYGDRETNTSSLKVNIISAITSQIEGTDNEIKVTKANSKIKIGFADDAVFGYFSNNK